MNEKNEDKKKKQKQLYALIAFGIVVGLAIIIALLVGINEKNNDKEQNMAYTDLIEAINEQRVEKLEMTVGSTTAKVKIKDVEKEKNAIIPNTQSFMEFIQEKKLAGNEINLIQKPQNVFLKIPNTIFTMLPTLLMLVIVVLFFQMQSIGDKGKIYDGDENKTNVRFKDIAGLDEEKKELEEIVNFLKQPKRFYEMGAKVPKGILLYGKPGTGKTLIAKAIAGEAGVPFISMGGSDFSSIFAGFGTSRVRKLFERARKLAPCIIFIDEIDAIGSTRTNGGTGVEADNNQTLNQLLVEMDGFEENQTIIVLAATNRPEMLDKALLRPGRFDRQITIAPPDVRGREEILKIHSEDKKFASNVSLKSIAEDTAGYTGAELANILNESAIIATINGHDVIEQDDIEEAVKKVTVGVQKKTRVISDREKKLTAYHEAGHAIVGKFLETTDPLKEISIIPRGMAGGYTMYKTNEDKFYRSKIELEERLVGLLGGRAAEKLALNDISTGARNDIQVATEIAKDMITAYGMSERLGPISLEENENVAIFGESIQDVIGVEVKTLIDTAYNDAQEILKANMDKLDTVANLLLEKETITAEEFDKIFE